MKRVRIAFVLALILCIIPTASFASSEYCDKYGHTWDEYIYGSYYQFSESFHKHVTARCYYCDAEKYVLEPHYYTGGYPYKLATPKENGLIEDSCLYCDKTIYKPVAWQYGTEYSTDYDINDHSYITRNSRSVKINVNNALPGSKIKLKIGKKTYTKKVTSTKKSIKIKIKKPVKYGQKVKITVTYKGKVIGRDKCDSWDVVWYANKVKVGMTKKQVKYTWGTPDDTSSSSGGWNHWYYGDGSRVSFKNGKVKSWYDTEG